MNPQNCVDVQERNRKQMYDQLRKKDTTVREKIHSKISKILFKKILNLKIVKKLDW